MKIRNSWMALVVVVAACAPDGPDDPDLDPSGPDRVESDDPAQAQAGDGALAQSRDGGPAQSRDGAPAQSTDVGPVQSTGGGPVQSTDGGAVQLTDASQVQKKDAGQAQAKDAGQVHAPDAAQAQPVDAGQAHPPEPPSETDPLAGLAKDWQARAAGYLEPRTASWLAAPPDIANVKCAMSCHTSFAYLIARPSLALFAPTPAADDVRARLETRMSETAAGTALPFYGSQKDDTETQAWGTESILNAAVFALDDVGRGGALSASAKTALDRMWSLQRADGAWDWLAFKLEPWETRNDFGAAIAALVAGSIPPGSSAAQAAGTAALISYVRSHIDSMVLHDRAIAMYASSKLTTLLEPAQAQKVAAQLTATQLPDGGFSLGSWAQGAQASMVANISDGYATAVAVLALCTGLPGGSKRPDVRKGLSWLARHQAADGSWPGQSVNYANDQRGYMADAATAYASLALTQCAL